jgi:hypothetical protein
MSLPAAAGANVSVTPSACQDAPRRSLFSDRLWIVKLGLAVGLFAFLCRRSEEEISDLVPEIEVAVAETTTHLKKPVHVWAHEVLAVSSDGFDVRTKAGPVHVVSSFPPPKPGDYVTFAGQIDAPKRVVASAVRIENGYLWKRGLNYGISSLTVLVFLWFARRTFRWKMSTGLFRSRY